MMTSKQIKHFLRINKPLKNFSEMKDIFSHSENKKKDEKHK